MVALERGTEPVGDPRIAHSIMGANFIGREDLEEHFSKFLSVEELNRAGGVKFSLRRLQRCKDTHILFLGYPLCVSEVQKLTRMHWADQGLWPDESCGQNRKVRVGWYLMAKQPIPASLGLERKEKLKLLKRHERMPWVCELVYVTMLWFLCSGERLFSDAKVVADDGQGGLIAARFPETGLILERKNSPECRDSALAPIIPPLTPLLTIS